MSFEQAGEWISLGFSYVCIFLIVLTVTLWLVGTLLYANKSIFERIGTVGLAGAAAAGIWVLVGAVPARADTMRFSAERVRLGVYQVDIAFAVYLPPACRGRWSLRYPPGFSYRRGSPEGGNLYGSPGRGSYDIALDTDACASPGSSYVEPARTVWHRIVVY